MLVKMKKKMLQSAENNNRLLEQLKSGFRRSIKWNKYISQMSNQNKNNNLNYLIDPTFSNVNRLFVLSFENVDDRTSYYKYYLPNVEIKITMFLLMEIRFLNCL